MKRALTKIAAMVCAAAAMAADSGSKRTVHAVRVASPPSIDGDLSDAAWREAPEITGFTQRDPEDGKPATQNSTVRIVYDDEAVYIGAKLDDTRPVTTLLGRRDTNLESDWFRVYVDSQYDRLSGAGFFVNPSNVQIDTILYNDIYQDSTWDAVWSSAAKIVPGGWIVEMRIPFSQLRFSRKEVHTWGINFARRIASNNEWAWLVNTPKGQQGLASRFADLTGIEGVRPERTFEVVPYGVARADLSSRVDASNPFAERMTHRMDGGVDLKYGITSNLTLTGTINPDFGQVEVDPAVVNLSQFETFYPEKRPFFTEGSQMFRYGNGPASSRWGFNFGAPTFFYSRRIGRSPQGRVNAEYVDAPGETTILGAAKITGKFGDGWSIGVLDAVTDRETAHFERGSHRGTQSVEPMSNYFVGRMAKEYGSGNSRLGVMLTSVNRNVPEELSSIRSDAYFGGIDGYTLFRNKSWLFEWLAAATRVEGSPEAIAATQRSPVHQYQRPDAGHLAYDPQRTALDGWGMRAMLARQTGRWRPNIQVQSYSPGFEVNDAGFLSRADMTATHAVLQYLDQEPKKRTRERGFWAGKFQNWNHDGDLLANGVMGNAYVLWNNYLQTWGWAGYNWETLDDRKTRGGPLVPNRSDFWWGGGFGTDSRKTFSATIEGEVLRSEDGSNSRYFYLGLNVRPSPGIRLGLTPSYRRQHEDAQYVAPGADGRPLFAQLEQRTLEIGTRVEWTASARLSLQLYLQPFVASGDYHDFKTLAAPRASNYVSSPAGADPDFNFRSVRGSAVVRWEFRPGSALYVVWNENRSEVAPVGDFRPRRDLSAIPSAPSRDVFLVKISYWLPL